MARNPKIQKPTPEPDKIEVRPANRVEWPATLKEMSKTPRKFRMERLDQFAWQAYCTTDNVECPIGKPDLFDILVHKVTKILETEGQTEFLAKKNQAEKDKLAKDHAKAVADKLRIKGQANA